MPFDISQFREENKDYYGDKSLNDVAFDIYFNNESIRDKYGSYDDFAKSNGFDKSIEFENKYNSAPSRGFLSDIAASVLRVPARTAEAISNAVSGVARIASYPFSDYGDNPVSRIADASSDWWSRAADAIPQSKESLSSPVRNAFTSGVESAGSSLAISAFTGGLANAKFLSLSSLLSAAPAYGLSEFDRTVVDAKESGVSSRDVFTAAAVSGISETGTEILSDIISARLGGFGGTYSLRGLNSIQKDGTSSLLRMPASEAARIFSGIFGVS